MKKIRKRKFDTFSRLCARADVIDDFSEPLEETMQKAFSRLCTIDSRRLIQFLLKILPKINKTDFSTLSPAEHRMMQMFYVSVWLKTADDWKSVEVLENLYALADSPVLLGELMNLVKHDGEKPMNITWKLDHPIPAKYLKKTNKLVVG